MIDEKFYWAATLQAPGIGPKSFIELLEILHTHQLHIHDLWQMKRSELLGLQFSEVFCDRWVTFRHSFNIETFVQDLDSSKVFLTSLNQGDYPKLLKEIPSPPPVLYYRGDLSSINHKPLAVVGTRKITSYGRYVTELLTQQLVEYRYSIISGFMYGVDGLAHQTAIASNGYTVGALGFGFQHMYPARHQRLAEELLKAGGALVTEFPPQTQPHPGNFPARNRIVAGLSLGVVVTEAAKESGSKITAQFAGDYGREVFCVAGAITSPFSEGTKDLANSGAKLITGVHDIIEEFEPQTIPQTRDQFAELLTHVTDPIDRKILESLSVQSIEGDQLIRELQLDVAVVSGRLTWLELQGLIMNQQGVYSLQLGR